MPSPRPGVRSRNALCVGPGCAGAFFASGTQTGAHLPQLYQKPLILLARPNRTSPPRRLILHTERLHAAVPALAGRSHRSRRVHARRPPSILAGMVQQEQTGGSFGAYFPQSVQSTLDRHGGAYSGLYVTVAGRPAGRPASTQARPWRLTHGQSHSSAHHVGTRISAHAPHSVRRSGDRGQ